jgi:hypothetical protein
MASALTTGTPTHLEPKTLSSPLPDPGPTDSAENLDWEEFSARYFPGRRRHDLEALTAYSAYRRDLDMRLDATVRLRAARG